MTGGGRPAWAGRRRSKRSARGLGTAGSRAERRQMTVMFVDLVGSTEMAERHEPEVVRDVVVRYQRACGAAVERHGGHIANYMGDGVLAYFGFPVAREHDARQAVLAGMDLVAAIEQLGDGARADHGVDVGVRVGVHTGLVLVSDMGTPDRPARDAIVGTAPNEAARIQAVAPPGAVVISDTTSDIVRGYFDVESLGRPALKGVSRRVEVFRVLGVTEASDRLQAAGRALTPLVGRGPELRLLHEHWHELNARRSCPARIVLLTGEAGIGKSRLAGEIVRDVVADGDPVLLATCSPDRTTSPLFPIVRMLESHLGFEPDDDSTARLDHLERACDAVGLARLEAVPVLAVILEIPTVERYSPLQLDPRALRERTFQTIVAFVRATADRRRTLLVVEDLQWADQSTLELISRLNTTAPAAGLLALTTSRPEQSCPWVGGCCFTILVEPMPPDDHQSLIHELDHIHALPEGSWEVIAARSDGNPLFTEQLAKSISQTAAGDAVVDSIPTTIRDLLTARLDALGRNKRLAQVAATIGREVDVDVLRSVTGLGRRAAAVGLAQLVRAGILEELARPEGGITHRFVHALVRDAAYDSQERLHDRRDAHLSVARALLARADADAAVVAGHFDAAAGVEEAVRYYLLAATTAQASAAHVEAIRLLDRALELVVSLPDGPARDVHEINVRMLRAISYVNTEGYASPSAGEDYRRGLESAERAGENLDVMATTTSVWTYYLVRGDIRAAGAAIRDMETRRPPELDAELLAAATVHRFFQGDLAESRALAEAAAASFTRRPADALVSPRWQIANDQVVVNDTTLGVLLSLVGDSDRSAAAFERASTRAAALPFPVGPFSQGYTLCYAGWVANLEGRFVDGRAIEERMVKIAERFGLLFWTVTCGFHAAISRAHLGQAETALDDAEAGLIAWRALGAEAFVPCNQTQLAEIRLVLGDLNEAMRLVDEAIASAEKRGERFFLAESHRMRAAILRRRADGDRAEVRHELETSRTIAASQGALVFEVRALTDLVELGGTDADVEDLSRLLDRLPAASRPLRDVDRARAVLAAGQRAGPGAQAGAGGSS